MNNDKETDEKDMPMVGDNVTLASGRDGVVRAIVVNRDAVCCVIEMSDTGTMMLVPADYFQEMPMQ